MKEKHTFVKTINFKPSMAAEIQQTANDFKTSFAEIVRECVEKELPRLIKREYKRKQSQQEGNNRDDL